MYAVEGCQRIPIIVHCAFCLVHCPLAVLKGPIPGTPVVVHEWQEGANDEDDGKTPAIEREHVQAVYDTIAPHWQVNCW